MARYSFLSTCITTHNFAHQRVLLRADLNVPLDKQGTILNEHRLSTLLPTIDLLLARKATITIVTHIGRPKEPSAALSTQQFLPWFEQRGYEIYYAATLDEAYTLSHTHTNVIILLENVRFFNGEKESDVAFAKQLARLGDYYVNDAFATLHRTDTSIALVPTLFPFNKRCLGLLVEKELYMLNQLLDKPKRPYVVVVGGGKVADKIPLLVNMLDKADTILLCPAIVFSFLYAHGIATGKSLVDTTSAALCRDFLMEAQRKGVHVVLPTDYIVANEAFDGPLQKESVTETNFPPNAVGISIGPKTAEHYAEICSQAQSLFMNGLMGSVQRPETLTSTATIFNALAHNTSALRIIGGGDSVAAAELLAPHSNIGYFSTGGGATLMYLSGQPLPGLLPFVVKK